jgi:Fic family protein
MASYIHQREAWPKLYWDGERLASRLAAVHERQGRLLRRMEELGFSLRAEASLRSLTEDVVKSGAIEGEKLDGGQVRSSLARRLGLDIGALKRSDRYVDGVAEMMLDATQNYGEVLTAERLFSWHAALFPAGRSGLRKITVGAWRKDKTGPMQVVSGPEGRPHVHFQASAAARVAPEMRTFLKWFNTYDGTDLVLRAGLAHFRFVTIHPFEDGNGRIARALADMMLARAEKSTQRFYSMSAQIQAERKTYYDRLEAAQKGGLDITPWLDWFLACLSRAIGGAGTSLSTVLAKAAFWQRHAGEDFNERQRRVLNRLLDGLEAKLTSSKYAILAKTSQDTAGRDIADLVARRILKKDPGGGRSTSYSLASD